MSEHILRIAVRSAAALLLATTSISASAEQITLLDKDGRNQETWKDVYRQCTIERISERQIAPGTTHLRLRLPDYKTLTTATTQGLNVNIVMVDLTNPYNTVENSIANESSKGTELLTAAAIRQSREGHQAVAAANANFWVVGSQAEYPLYAGITRGVSVRNGEMVTDGNGAELFGGGTERSGIAAITSDKRIMAGYCTGTQKLTLSNGKTYTINGCNKRVAPGEIAIYTDWFGSRSFIPVQNTYTWLLDETSNDAVEVLLDLADGETWMGGRDISFVVRKVTANTNRGNLEGHNLAIVTRHVLQRATFSKLQPGDIVKLNYSWTFTADNSMPQILQAVSGNGLVMENGELTPHNFNEQYNYQVYSRTGYGSSADGKTLYMIVIDRSVDPVYGRSVGCSTAVMAQIARHFGCANMLTFDAGGSAEMMVGNRIINKTTESTPRRVANGFMVFNTAPSSSTLDHLMFDYPGEVIQIPAGGSLKTALLGYNQYGSLIDDAISDFELTCSNGIGTCSGTTINASATPAYGTVTATYKGLTVTKEVSVGGASSAIDDITADPSTAPVVEYYNLQGIPAGRDASLLAPGLYVGRTSDGGSRKIIIK